MPIHRYGVLKGRVIGRLRDADDDHYQVLISDGKTQYRIAVNVKSKATNAPSSLLFVSKTSLPATLTAGLKKLKKGVTELKSKPGTVAQDFVRGGVVDTSAMKPVPPDDPNSKNDLKDLLDAAIGAAMDDVDAVVYAFGQVWGPETKRDQYFHFLPGNGIHDIHMNQGNGGQFKKDNGIYQDGCLIVQSGETNFTGFFMAFQSQTFDTDENGNPKPGSAAAAETAPTKRTKKGRRTKPAAGGGGKKAKGKASKPAAKAPAKAAVKAPAKAAAKTPAKAAAKTPAKTAPKKALKKPGKAAPPAATKKKPAKKK